VPSQPPYIRLQYERNKRRWTQDQVGVLIHTVAGHHRMLSQNDISLLERGRLNPTPEELAALGRLFKITPASVLMKPVIVVDPEPEEEPEDTVKAEELV
jgi:transcriptional regulator with XRE-family HTH domain